MRHAEVGQGADEPAMIDETMVVQGQDVPIAPDPVRAHQKLIVVQTPAIAFAAG